MKPEIAKLIIASAIQNEIDAFRYYTEVAAKVQSPSLKELFSELAEEERKHREFLEGILSKGTVKLNFAEGKDFKVVDTLPVPAITGETTPVDGIVISIKHELEAMQTYTQLASLSTDIETQLLFSQLANMERGHKTRLEDLYTNMAFPETW